MEEHTGCGRETEKSIASFDDTVEKAEQQDLDESKAGKDSIGEWEATEQLHAIDGGIGDLFEPSSSIEEVNKSWLASGNLLEIMTCPSVSKTALQSEAVLRSNERDCIAYPESLVGRWRK